MLHLNKSMLYSFMDFVIFIIHGVFMTTPLFAFASVFFLPLFSAFCTLWGKMTFFDKHHKKIVFSFSLIILALLFHDILHHEHEGEELVYMTVSSLLTFGVLATLHIHHSKNEVAGLISAEFFHSLVDGVILGFAYMATPLLFYASSMGIIAHELPKVVATAVLLRSLGKNKKKTALYAFLHLLLPSCTPCLMCPP